MVSANETPVNPFKTDYLVYGCPMSAGISGASRADLVRVVGYGRRFVTVTDVEEALGVERPEAAKRLARWAGQGWLRRVRRDLYIPVPVDALDPASWGADPLVIADAVWDPCYVSGWTAANHWGLTEQSFRTIVIKSAARVRRSRQRLLDTDYLLAHTNHESLEWGMAVEWREERRIRIADPARTVIDILDDPRLGGGIRVVGEVLGAYLDDHDPAQLLTYGDRLGNGTVFKRLGYLGETLGVTGALLAECESRLPSGVSLLDPALAGTGPRSARWRLRLNATVGGQGPS